MPKGNMTSAQIDKQLVEFTKKTFHGKTAKELLAQKKQTITIIDRF